MTCGRLSFVPPARFVLIQAASLLTADPAAADVPGIAGIPSAVTLVDMAVPPDVVDYSESAHDMRPDAYPATLTLLIHAGAESPMAYLRNSETVMTSHFSDYQVDFLKKAAVADFQAAISQAAYQRHFKIYRLCCVRRLSHRLVISSLMTSAPETTAGWELLRRFAASVAVDRRRRG